jgi:LmbE family N-acetylglucosaminyl deacetylase
VKRLQLLIAAVAVLAVTGGTPLGAQERGAAALAPLMEGLGTSARVLFIAAHPDDEDTQLITWLARGRHVETAYLSLTRGDGGQNLIGNELGEALGVIRTEELLAARRLDGGKQFFTRAFDFGFSKNADETYAHWPHDSLLRDVVTVIRTFRPHVIISVFSGTPRDGHGHHQVAGLLAREAYDVSGDTVQMPRSATAGRGGWTVQKFYRGAFFRAESGTLRINVGEFDPVAGRSYSEIAADSRSQHKSQAFGSLQRKGVRFDLLTREASRVAAPEDPKAEQSIFDGVDTTWTRFRDVVTAAPARAALDSLSAAFAEARQGLDLLHPERSIPSLTRIERLLGAICGPRDCSGALARDDRVVSGPQADLMASLDVAKARVAAALVQTAGIAVEATADREIWSIGESVPVSIAVYNRGRIPVTLSAYGVRTDTGAAPADGERSVSIAPDSLVTVKSQVTLTTPSQAWWLARPRVGAMFSPRVSGVEDRSRPLPAEVALQLEIDAVPFTARIPVVYRYADPIKGERNLPIAAAPAITVTLDREVEYAPANSPLERPVRVHVRSAASTEREVEVSLRLPAGLVADIAQGQVKLPPGAVRTVTFAVRGRLAAGRHTLDAVATSDGQTFTSGYTAIEYDHIRTQRLYRPSTLGIEAVDLSVPRGMRIAYINGVGDNVAPMLQQLGLDVTVVDPAALPRTDLSRFGAVVVGSRAYEASEALVANNARLLDYVRDGGTMVVQYGQYEMQSPGILPYPITLARPADRVTIEDAPVKVLAPNAGVLTSPNRISEADFAGWVQDRSIYMPRTFDPRYASVIEMNDPGEPPNKGGILVAPFGKGTYVYATLAFFRQLPNGVPGAARLMVNLMAAKAPRTVQ